MAPCDDECCAEMLDFGLLPPLLDLLRGRNPLLEVSETDDVWTAVWVAFPPKNVDLRRAWEQNLRRLHGHDFRRERASVPQDLEYPHDLVMWITKHDGFGRLHPSLSNQTPIRGGILYIRTCVSQLSDQVLLLP